MTADRVSLTEGYEGAIQGHRNVAGSGEGVHGIAKKQHSQTGELQGQNKGAFATQAANGSTATANNLGAAALLHSTNAEHGGRFVKQTAAHEDEASSGQASESNALDQAASDLHSKINRA